MSTGEENSEEDSNNTGIPQEKKRKTGTGEDEVVKVKTVSTTLQVIPSIDELQSLLFYDENPSILFSINQEKIEEENNSIEEKRKREVVGKRFFTALIDTSYSDKIANLKNTLQGFEVSFLTISLGKLGYGDEVKKCLKVACYVPDEHYESISSVFEKVSAKKLWDMENSSKIVRITFSNKISQNTMKETKNKVLRKYGGIMMSESVLSLVVFSQNTKEMIVENVKNYDEVLYSIRNTYPSFRTPCFEIGCRERKDLVPLITTFFNDSYASIPQVKNCVIKLFPKSIEAVKKITKYCEEECYSVKRS